MATSFLNNIGSEIRKSLKYDLKFKGILTLDLPNSSSNARSKFNKLLSEGHLRIKFKKIHDIDTAWLITAGKFKSKQDLNETILQFLEETVEACEISNIKLAFNVSLCYFDEHTKIKTFQEFLEDRSPDDSINYDLFKESDFEWHDVLEPTLPIVKNWSNQ